MMTAFAFASALDAAHAIRTGATSSLELTQELLSRIDNLNPKLNAVVTLQAERALKRAQEADQALARHDTWGPLHGVPITLKDSHATAGMRTTSGFPPLAGYVPEEDGAVASRLNAAGAIIMGKTNVPLLVGDVQTDNAIFGRTNNPWNLGRTPGGSSGGAAAALAAGLTPLETRSDIAGSIRIPAHFCGLYGLKPTERRVSSAGHIPDLPGSPRTVRMMATSGPLARSIEGLYLAFRLIAGADLHDSEVPPLPIQDFPEVHLNELRISFATSFPGVPVANDIHQAIVRFVNDLSGGAALVDERLPRVVFEAQWQARDELRRSSSVFIGEGPPLTVAEYFRMLDLRDSFIRTWELFFSDWGVLICPVAPCTAFPHCPIETQLKVDEVTIDYWQVLSHCTPFSYTGHPAVVLPIGQDRDGLPIGVQVVARRWNDERLLAIAQVMTEITDGIRHPEL